MENIYILYVACISGVLIGVTLIVAYKVRLKGKKNILVDIANFIDSDNDDVNSQRRSSKKYTTLLLGIFLIIMAIVSFFVHAYYYYIR